MEGLSASECPACSQPLGYDQRVPYSLPCGHTLCHPCIKRLRKDRQPCCPLCRFIIVDIRNVKVNVTLYQLLQQLRSGTQFGRSLSISYEELELGKLLDRGASGEVYCGQWQGNDVAIKMFASGQLSLEAFESFKREVCVMSCLRHPNVVMLMASCQSPPRLMIVMEYVTGGSLYALLHIKRSVLQPDQVAKVTMDICRGLQYLHSINILHRDLKSKNVLLTGIPPNCQAKLCDFGLARMRLESATMTGNVGTVHWTAPEVLNSERYKFPADVYSLGMVLYEMVSNKIPFGSLMPPAVIVAVLIKREKPCPPEYTHPVLSEMINDCTSYEPSDRPDIGQLLRQLNPLLTNESPDGSADVDLSHTDSLGHIMLEFDSTEDSHLIELLADSEDENDNAEGESEEQQQQIWEREPDGVLPRKELEELRSFLPPPNYAEPSKLPAPNQLLSKKAHVKYSSRSKQKKAADTSPDFNLAVALQSKEQRMQMKKDYIIASRLQEQEEQLRRQEFIRNQQIEREQFSFISTVPPPPPLPFVLPQEQIEFKRSQSQMIVANIKGGGSIRWKLNHVEPVEKRAFRVGRVLDASNGMAALYSTQNQIRSFNTKWLTHVQVKEPEPPFPVGRVIKSPYSHVRQLIKQMNSELCHYDKSKMHMVQTVVKNPLPTSQDIKKEKAEEMTLKKKKRRKWFS